MNDDDDVEDSDISGVSDVWNASIQMLLSICTGYRPASVVYESGVEIELHFRGQ